MNECYNGGAEDALFAGGGAQVPRGLLNSAAGRDREGSDLPMGGSGGGDDGDDGDGSNEPDARLDEEDHLKSHPLQDCTSSLPPPPSTHLSATDSARRPGADNVTRAAQQEDVDE